MLKQKNRRACLNAIKSRYSGEVELLADRRGRGCYWSIWSYGHHQLLEVVKEKGKISIYEFLLKR